MDTKEISIGQLCVQVHLARAPEIDLAALKVACELFAKATLGMRGIGFSEGNDEGDYLNITLAVDDSIYAWQQVRRGLLESTAFGKSLKASCMVVCTGAEGWDDYLLLYHYDPSVPVDSASDA